MREFYLHRQTGAIIPKQKGCVTITEYEPCKRTILIERLDYLSTVERQQKTVQLPYVVFIKTTKKLRVGFRLEKLNENRLLDEDLCATGGQIFSNIFGYEVCMGYKNVTSIDNFWATAFDYVVWRIIENFERYYEANPPGPDGYQVRRTIRSIMKFSTSSWTKKC